MSTSTDYAHQLMQAIKSDDLNTVRTIVAADPFSLLINLCMQQQDQGRQQPILQNQSVGHVQQQPVHSNLIVDQGRQQSQTQGDYHSIILTPFAYAALECHIDVIKTISQTLPRDSVYRAALGNSKLWTRRKDEFPAINDTNRSFQHLYESSFLMVKLVVKGQVEICRMLIQEFAVSPNSLNKDTQEEFRKTLLAIAVQQGNIDMCRMLISQGANVNYYVSETNNPLFNAVRFNREEICRLLLASGSSVNAIVYKSTMLNYAVRSGNENICKMLIEAGANLEGSPDSEFTPFCEAVHWDRISIVRLLASYGVDIYAKRRRAPFIDVMEIAACRNSQEMMQVLYELAGNQSNGFKMRSAVNLACTKNNVDTALLAFSLGVPDF